MDHTLIDAEEGVLTFHVEGEVDRAAWRAWVAVGVSWLLAQGGGKLLLPHPPLLTS